MRILFGSKRLNVLERETRQLEGQGKLLGNDCSNSGIQSEF
jgi:hypothetical protein